MSKQYHRPLLTFYLDRPPDTGDRGEDFRTEVLGLVKAQQVKNSVIVPVGAKGGFFAKKLSQSMDREAFMAEGIACYKIFISALLSIPII